MTQPILTINTGAACANWRALDVLSGTAETAAAVKANGYGCGAVEISRALEAAGCRTFFVATVEEGVSLRTALRDPVIYILNGVADREDAAACLASGLRPCLNHPGQIETWQGQTGHTACALQLDSGMSRLGLQPSELEKVPGGIDVRLVMSHLACADEPGHEANAFQYENFVCYADVLKDRVPEALRSLAATGGTLLGQAYHFDLVRCGVGLYGGAPYMQARPVVSLETPILQIRDIPAGQGVGYGWSWTAKRPSRIGILPLGYADGMHRALSNNATLYICGKPLPLIGRVSMDLITVDLTEHPQAQVGHMVEILGPNQSVDDLATAAGTIGYEILTSLGQRYTKRYTQD